MMPLLFKISWFFYFLALRHNSGICGNESSGENYNKNTLSPFCPSLTLSLSLSISLSWDVHTYERKIKEKWKCYLPTREMLGKDRLAKPRNAKNPCSNSQQWNTWWVKTKNHEAKSWMSIFGWFEWAHQVSVINFCPAASQINTRTPFILYRFPWRFCFCHTYTEGLKSEKSTIKNRTRQCFCSLTNENLLFMLSFVHSLPFWVIFLLPPFVFLLSLHDGRLQFVSCERTARKNQHKVLLL